jgi:hypothetical protein
VPSKFLLKAVVLMTLQVRDLFPAFSKAIFGPPALDFRAAYEASPALQKYVTRDQLNESQAALLAALPAFRKLKRFSAYEPKLMQAQLLLHAYAKGHTRTHNGEATYLHTLQLGQDFLTDSKNIITNRTQRLWDTIEIMLHDGIEDFGIPPEMIREIFGEEMSRRVISVTTPPIEELVFLYPTVTNKYVSLNILEATGGTEFLSGLKNERPGVYEALRLELKTTHKCKTAESYTLSQAIYRARDNDHSLRSYAEDIRRGIIYVVRSAQIVEIASRKPRVLSTNDAHANIARRSQCHEAILGRIHALKEQAELNGCSPHDLYKLEAAAGIITRHFETAKTAFEKALVHPISQRPLGRVRELMARAASIAL